MQIQALPLLSKVSERIIYNQLGKYMESFLTDCYTDLEKPILLSMPSLSYYNDGRRNLIILS